MDSYQQQFVSLAVAAEALKFGEFTLKSGRISPYFFNAGKFYQGEHLATLGRCYAQAIVNSGVKFDVLFGPAYKGITLAAATAIALSTEHGLNVPYCFNRKEAKAHGEGGLMVGAPLEGRILVIDDVITAGTAIREVMGIIIEAGATPAGVVIGLDRQEKGVNERSAVQDVAAEYAIPVMSIVGIDHIIGYLETAVDSQAVLENIKRYRQRYAV